MYIKYRMTKHEESTSLFSTHTLVTGELELD